MRGLFLLIVVIGCACAQTSSNCFVPPPAEAQSLQAAFITCNSPGVVCRLDVLPDGGQCHVVSAHTIAVTAHPTLQRFVFPALRTARQIGLWNNPALRSIELPLLDTIDSTAITPPQPAVRIVGNAVLENATFPSLHTLLSGSAGPLIVADNPVLRVLVMPALTTSTSSGAFILNASLSTIGDTCFDLHSLTSARLTLPNVGNRVIGPARFLTQLTPGGQFAGDYTATGAVTKSDDKCCQLPCTAPNLVVGVASLLFMALVLYFI